MVNVNTSGDSDNEYSNESSEPMDVDSSVNSSKLSKNISQFNVSDFDDNHQSDQSTNPNNSMEESVNVKKLHVNLSLKRTKPKFPVKTLIFLIVSIAIFIPKILPTCTNIDLEFLSSLLQDKVYGQSLAIEKLITSLKSEDAQKLTFVIGPTGVGKTYALNLITNTYSNASNIYVATPSSIKTDITYSQIFFTSYFCSYNLVIVDDLLIHDNQVFTIIKELLMKSQALNKRIHIILVFNSDVTDENLIKTDNFVIESRLAEIFQSFNINKSVIRFQKLSNVHLLQCIQHKLEFYSKTDKHKPEDLLKYFNVELDGCKNVGAKIKGVENL